MSGRWRWLSWLALCTDMMFIHIHRSIPGVAIDQLMAGFGLSAEDLGTLSSIYFYLYVAGQVPAGTIVDWLGA